MIERLRDMTRGPLVRGVSWLTLALLAKTALQAFYFVAVARALGVTGVGAVAATLAVTSLLIPFASMGSGSVMVMRVARSPAVFHRYWGNAILVTCVTSIPLILVSAAFGRVILPPSTYSLLVPLGVAELLFSRLTEVASQAFQALERLGAAAMVGVILPLARSGAALTFLWAASVQTPMSWAYWYLAASVIAGLVSIVAVSVAAGMPRPDVRSAISELRLGLLFAIGLSSSSVSADIDKSLLARLASLREAGVYAAGYRVASLALTPVWAVIYATYPRFFKRGAGGPRESYLLARQLLPPCLAYAALAGVGLFLIAPVLPYLLGDGFEQSVDVVRWLAVLPALELIASLPANALAGSGHQGQRALLLTVSAVINIILNIILIPPFGWQGSAAATIVSYAFLATAMWLAIYRKQRLFRTEGVLGRA
jgi:O-antigen/teichoic acid export membrane protein